MTSELSKLRTSPPLLDNLAGPTPLQPREPEEEEDELSQDEDAAKLDEDPNRLIEEEQIGSDAATAAADDRGASDVEMSDILDLSSDPVEARLTAKQQRRKDAKN